MTDEEHFTAHMRQNVCGRRYKLLAGEFSLVVVCVMPKDHTGQCEATLTVKWGTL